MDYSPSLPSTKKHFFKNPDRQFCLVSCAACSPSLRIGQAAQTVYENYTFTTLAGPDEAGPGWQDGRTNGARFGTPAAVAEDSAGNIYVADSLNHTIRKISADGVVSTVAGSTGFSGSADGIGAFARFNAPNGIAVDGAGNLFVADSGNNTIRKSTPSWRGDVTTFAAAGRGGGSNKWCGECSAF